MLHILAIIKTTPDVRIVGMVAYLNIHPPAYVKFNKKKCWSISLPFPPKYLDTISQQCSVMSHFYSQKCSYKITQFPATVPPGHKTFLFLVFRGF